MLQDERVEIILGSSTLKDPSIPSGLSDTHLIIEIKGLRYVKGGLKDKHLVGFILALESDHTTCRKTST